MSDTKIEWAEKVWNPLTGCTAVSEGCRNCYARRMAQRLAGRNGYPSPDGFVPTVHLERFAEPGKWYKPHRVFVCSMSDIFHESFGDATLRMLFSIMASNNEHTFMVLTKRPDRMKDFVPRLRWRIGLDIVAGTPVTRFAVFSDDVKNDAGGILSEHGGLYPNIWLGVTAENQAAADKRIPALFETPGAFIRFVSVEPMLGPVDLSKYLKTGLLTWVICGGESGPGARPMHPDWARSLRDQCSQAGVPFFFKQWGEYIPGGFCDIDSYDDVTKALKVEEWVAVASTNSRSIGKTCFHAYDPSGRFFDLNKIGKKQAGRVLDGRTWDEYPKAH
jgi:protein gp37